MRTETAKNLMSHPHADGNRAKFVRTERPKFRDFGSDLCQHMHGSCRMADAGSVWRVFNQRPSTATTSFKSEATHPVYLWATDCQRVPSAHMRICPCLILHPAGDVLLDVGRCCMHGTLTLSAICLRNKRRPLFDDGIRF